MRRRTRAWLIMAAFLVILGSLLFAAVMTVNRWDFTKLSTVEYDTSSYQIGEEFRDILIEADTADVILAPPDDGKCTVICHERADAPSSLCVEENETLIIRENDNRKWHTHIDVAFESPSITVCLPRSEYASLTVTGSTGNVEIPEDFSFDSMDISISTGNINDCASSEILKISTTTGDITIADSSAKAIDLSTSTGNVKVSDTDCEGGLQISVTTGETELSDVSCGELISKGTTGGILLERVIAAGKISVERSTGDIRFDDSDAAEILIATATGDITGSLLSEKQFIAHSDTGSVKVPDSGNGGSCEINSDTGDIQFKINP